MNSISEFARTCLEDLDGPPAPELVFEGFPKMARLSRDIVITEKIDGSNAQVCIGNGTLVTHPHAIEHRYNAETQTDEVLLAGSRTRWVTHHDDNYGFAKWVAANSAELWKLEPGRHFGEWWGQGIQRKYGLAEKRFSLFNTGRWVKPRTDGPTPALEGQLPCPDCCHVVPVLYRGPFDTNSISDVLLKLKECGSEAAPGFMKPEGIVVFHTAANFSFKKTLEKDESPKSACLPS